MPHYDEAIRGDREAVRIQKQLKQQMEQEETIYCAHSGCINPVGPQQLHCSEHGGFKIFPVNDQVLLRLIAPEQHTHGLYIPDSAKREASELWRGEVIAVGPGEIDKRNGKRIPMAVKPGDRVVCYHIGGNTATHLDDEHIVLSETYIQAVLED